ncbi:hypothetical protein LY01_01544 [Nonlabens xylanidelens]|uniref:Fibronectin type 3 domain-containing protein n=1 Tax=Nonlabens xylanidelens TaxID=191564 RepID=A0A2S6IKM9_9FLAO|nr:hypothetical protein [Nonlabens xylanidelens]PPK94792.1 hypothetical protein LY01_01544 [Nonlabens xylanidelens]
MKKYIIIIVLALFSIPSMAQFTENVKPSSTINVIGRYTDNAVELIYFPDKNKALYQGLKKGFIIERAEFSESSDTLTYKKIAEVFPYEEDAWSTLMANSKEETKKDITLAKEFYDNREKQSGGKFSFDEGIKEMQEQKFKEDFEYIIFVMNAIKNNTIARALALSYTDKTVEENKEYVYRISLKEKLENYTVGQGMCLMETLKESDKVERDIYVKTWDKKLTFIWEENDMITGAHVERKNNATGEFELLNKKPVLKSDPTSTRNSYTDQNLTNYTNYEYRFYGINPFGEKAYFGTASGMPKDLTPPVNPAIVSGKNNRPEEIKIIWKMPVMAPDLKGFVVARSTKNKGDFKLLHSKLLPKNTTSYIDKTFHKEKDNYYVVQAIDTTGNISSSSPYFVTVIDSIPPVKPNFISGKIDSLGIVTLDIELNKERDLMGYRLFRSNAPEHEFSVINEGFHEKDTIYTKALSVFKDTVTLKSLTPYIYYKIKALDYNFNQSPYSDILKVKRPDLIPPETPVFKNVKVGKEDIELEFILSSNEDVIEQTLYRKLDLKKEWIKHASLKNEQTTYIDKEVETGVKYFYTLRAKDDSDNYSDYSIPVMGKPYDDGNRPGVKNLRINREKDQVYLQWDYEQMNENTFFVIYKKNKKGQFIQHDRSLELRFRESEKNTSSYAIKVFTKDGGQSKLSEEVSIK